MIRIYRSGTDTYAVEIRKLENGYTLRIDNKNSPERVYENLHDLIEYVKILFGGN